MAVPLLVPMILILSAIPRTRFDMLFSLKALICADSGGIGLTYFAV
jgi:hypothetical protein